MKKGLFGFCLFLFCCGTVFAKDFTACKSKFALCTTATCKPLQGNKDFVSCTCDVKTGFSAGTKACAEPKEVKEGEILSSRYFPIKSYVLCNNSRPWAWCLDSPCLVNKKNPAKASCICSVVQNKGKYIIVTDKYTKTTCTTNLYSSATVDDVDEVTNFLKSQNNLQPYPIKVISS